MSRHYINSQIPVQVHDKTIAFVGRIQDSRKRRHVEIDALDRIAYGDTIAATNNAAKLRDFTETLRCSSSKCHQPIKHFTDFGKCRAYPWRADGREYYCKDCRKAQRLAGVGVRIDVVDDNYLRSKPNNRRKSKKLDIRAASA